LSRIGHHTTPRYREVGVGASELLIAVQKKYAKRTDKPTPRQFSV